ncbi:hypothetical protein [Haloparvum sedimenti]|uniref:hypothetical protein n=1 Tax=Haloparvum sedimenti TaxID=1678448 RepID=UPI00071E9684|nr:hypothetical protein [Haloparvum sedimenti]
MSTTAVDLEEMLNAQSTTPADERNRCPGCLTVSIRKRVPKNASEHYRGADPEQPYYCPSCDTGYEAPLRPRDDAYPELDERGRIVGGDD